MADTTALKNRIKAAIKANDNQEITGPVLQQALLDIVDELNGATETEADARQNGDSTLQQSINNEKQRAEDAEQILQTAIATEITRAEDAEQILQTAIATEKTRAEGTEQTLQTAIATETTRAEGAEQTLTQAIRNLRNAGYAFGGTAETDTNPGIPSGNCFYIVRGSGTYTYFKNADDESIVLSADGIYVLTYESVENQYWEWNLIVGIDASPTENSHKILESGGVFAALNSLQTAIRNLRNAGYAFGGTAETDTNPGIPSGNCFYIVRGSGTYTYFKNADDESIVLSADGIYVLTYESVENQYWEWNLITGINLQPKKGSTNLVTSGGVFDNIGALDVSELNASGGTLATYATFDAALAAIPSDYQKGGMSIKFVLSVDNTYVQYRLMKNQWSTAESDWQGVDAEPVAESENLIKSSGVYNEFYTQLQLKDQNCTITSNQDYPKELLGFTLKQGKRYNIKLTVISGITYVGASAFIQIWKDMTSLDKDEIKVSYEGAVTSNQVVLDTVYTPEVDMTAFRIGNFTVNGVVKVTMSELDVTKYATKDELNTLEEETEESLNAISENVYTLNEESTKNEEAMSIYPETEKTITYSEGWLQGYRRGNAGASVVSSSAYITSNLITLKKGDIVKFPDTNGLSNVWIIGTDGSVIIEFSYMSANLGNRFPYYVTDDVDVYFDVRNPDGITPSSAKPLYIVRQVDVLKPIADTTKIVKEIVGSQDDVWSEQKGNLIAARIGRGVSAGDDKPAGIEVPSNQYFITPFIPVEVGDEFVGASCQNVFKYSSAQNLESAFISFENYLVDGNINEIRIIRYKVSQTDWNNGVRFIRAEMNNTASAYPGKAFSRLADGDFKVLCLGDSQFGKITKPYDFPSWIQKETGFKAVNSGFGGTTACRHAASGDSYDYNEDIYNRLSLYNLADCIATGNFTSIDIDWGDSGDNDYDFNPKIQFLKEIDYSKLKLITFAYGGNDWSGDHALDNTENKYDKATYLGSLRYSIERILNAYPNIQIALLSPTWRCGKSLVSGNYVIDWTTDEKENLNGKLTMDFVEGMKSVAEEYHLPFFDNYTNLGINRFNEAYYIGDNPIDGSHYKWIAGGEYVGRRIAQEVLQVLSKN